MNNLQLIGEYADKTPIEVLLQVDEEGMVSARNAYRFLGLSDGQFSRWSKVNILENGFAVEGEDYQGVDIYVEGNYCPDYKLSIPFAKKLCMLSKTERGEQARNYFVKVEDTLKRVAQSKPLPQLTTNEMMLQMAQNAVELERQLADVKGEVQQIEGKLDTAIKIFAKPGNSWKDGMEIAMREMGGDGGWELIRFKGKLYRELEAITNADLQDRLTRKRNRMKKLGATQKERMAINKLDIISYDKQLRLILEGIVKRYQAAHEIAG